MLSQLKVKLKDRIKHLVNTAILEEDTDPLNTSLTLELKAKTGQVIFVELEEANARRGTGCNDQGGSYATRMQRYLGIIDQHVPFGINKDSKTIQLPTIKYVAQDVNGMDHFQQPWSLEELPIMLKWDELPDTLANNRYKSKLAPGEEMGFIRTLRLLVGEEAEQHFREGYTPDFLRGCVLLGYDASPQTKGEVVTAIKQMDEKGSAKESMQKKLAEAHELKLDQGTWSYDLQPGITINGPVYLNDLCRKYEVK